MKTAKIVKTVINNRHLYYAPESIDLSGWFMFDHPRRNTGEDKFDFLHRTAHMPGAYKYRIIINHGNKEEVYEDVAENFTVHAANIKDGHYTHLDFSTN